MKGHLVISQLHLETFTAATTVHQVRLESALLPVCLAIWFVRACLKFVCANVLLFRVYPSHFLAYPRCVRLGVWFSCPRPPFLPRLMSD